MTTTRRLWIYGLLLLLSALGVGALAVGLLIREQERLQAREQTAYGTRVAAVSDRARIIAENIELLVGDAQSALMTTLREAPADEPRPFLTEWQTYNPLVRDVFRATSAGRPVWGAGSDPLRDWLQTTPWREPSPAAEPAAEAVASAPADENAPAPSAGLAQAEPVVSQTVIYSQFQADQAANRAEVSQNVVQYQSARRSLEEVAKLKSAPAPSPTPAPAGTISSFIGLSRTSLSAESQPKAAKKSSAAKPSALASTEAQVDGQLAGIEAREHKATAGDFADKVVELRQDVDQLADAFAPPAQPVASAEVSFAPSTAPAAPAAPERSGWAWATADDGWHRYGWRQLADGTVIGLELRLEAIKSRLRDVFPVTPDTGETYQLLDAAGHVWEGRELAAGTVPLLTIPLSADVLPGWTIVAHLDDLRYGSADDGGFLVAGTAVVALLVGAILLSGALLLLQARRSEIEAAQKTSFVANVSHEFKTPLTTIRLYAELLAEGRVRDEAKRADYLRTIGGETQRLARLVGNVLDFSRLEQGRKKFELQPLDAAAELRALLDTHAPRLAEAGLALATALPGAPCPLTTDRDALQQIVLNLLDNACKYAADGREVSVALHCDAGGATIRVGDRGPGVPAAQRERIFEKFHRVDDRLTAAHAGTGLGLSIARQLARGLGGDLRCIARDGGGAEFVFTLSKS